MIELASMAPSPELTLRVSRTCGWWGIRDDSAPDGKVIGAGLAGRGHAGRPVSVVVIASDPITAEGTVGYLRSQPGIMPLGPDCVHRADVVLMLATLMTEETLDALQRIVGQARGREVSFVLVSGGVTAPKLFRVVSCGLVSVIPRHEADHQRIVQAIHAVTRGRVQLPGVALSGLSRAAAGLEAREVDVLRLLAEGLDTIEIAQKLCYSERTVKYIIHGLLSRFELRNRPHAVAFALRNGLL